MTILTEGLTTISLNALPGRWQKLDVADVPLLTSAEARAFEEETESTNIWGWNGSGGVFIAWNSAAFDPIENEMYFWGGGHADYGGNEVYQFDFDTLEWARLNDPAPLTAEAYNKDGKLVGYTPENGTPPAVHTYDGLTWNPVTQTIWMTSASSAFSTIGMNSNGSLGGAWEFDPNSLEWTLHDNGELRPAQTTWVGDGLTGQLIQMVYGKGYIHEPDGTLRELVSSGDMLSSPYARTYNRESSLFTDPETGKIYNATNIGIFEIDLIHDDAGTIVGLESHFIPDSPTNLWQTGFAYRTVDGKFYGWWGGDEITVFDPTDHSFEAISAGALGDAPSATLHGNGKVFEKWVYLEEIDSFAGIVNHKGGLWVYTPEDSYGGNPDRPDAVDDISGVLVNETATMDVLVNDSDPNNDVLTIMEVTQGVEGTVVINQDSTLSYTPNSDFVGNDFFTYTISDGNGGLSTAAVSLSVNEIGQAPQNFGPIEHSDKCG